MTFFKSFIKRIGFLIIIYSFSRIAFYFLNQEYFKDNILTSLLEGIRFDLSAIFYINIPILLLLLIPFNFRTHKWYARMTDILFYSINIPFILINNADIEYYNFALKRSTFDIFNYLSLGGGADIVTLMPKYLINYWHITLLSVIQILFLFRIKKTTLNKLDSYIKSTLYFLFSILITVYAARGGTQLKPIKPIDAGILSDTNNSILILNTPFCILHTLFDNELKEYNYLHSNELNEIYNTNHKYNKEFKKKNIIVIVLESFSKEFIGYHNHKGFTPFLDELMKESLVMENAYANGIKSIEALPAISSSIPTLMDNPFITSTYTNNQFKGLGSILKNEGYTTSFFHGGKRGTMGFYQFSKKSGLEKYFGLEEYNNINEYDGSWGIYDHAFFKYFKQEISKEQNPFLSILFSVSSHHPYNIPEIYEQKFNEGELEIHKTIEYTDHALKELFQIMKNEPWFQNTLFVITADHTSPLSSNSEYQNTIGRYSIPIIYFMGDSSLKGHTSNAITQQIDIMPTILDLIGYNKSFFSFGKSPLSTKKNWAINQKQDKYILILENGYIMNLGEKYTAYKDKNFSEEIKISDESIKLLKAIKQKYNESMLKNKLQ